MYVCNIEFSTGISILTKSIWHILLNVYLYQTEWFLYDEDQLAIADKLEQILVRFGICTYIYLLAFISFSLMPKC